MCSQLYITIELCFTMFIQIDYFQENFNSNAQHEVAAIDPSWGAGDCHTYICTEGVHGEGWRGAVSGIRSIPL